MKIEEFRNEIRQVVRQELNNTGTSITCNHASELQSLRADIIALHNENERLKAAMTSGNGLIKASSEASQDEYKRFAMARIEDASLHEVVKEVYAERGIDINNDRLWHAYLNQTKPTIQQTVKSVSK